MVMRADVLARAIDAVSPADDPRPRLLMSPRGVPLTQSRVRDLAAGPGVVVVCGRFEGVDQRVIEARALEEVSIGDYVLSGGEIAAMALLDACVRLLPGVMGNAESGTEESFASGCSNTRTTPGRRSSRAARIPEVITSGDHAKVAAWRHARGRAADEGAPARPLRRLPARKGMTGALRHRVRAPVPTENSVPKRSRSLGGPKVRATEHPS